MMAAGERKRMMNFEIETDLADAIDAYWHEHRLPSRAAAIRAILRAHLTQAGLLSPPEPPAG